MEAGERHSCKYCDVVQRKNGIAAGIQMGYEWLTACIEQFHGRYTLSIACTDSDLEYSQCLDIPIQYCPHCGRELSDE